MTVNKKNQKTESAELIVCFTFMIGLVIFLAVSTTKPDRELWRISQQESDSIIFESQNNIRYTMDTIAHSKIRHVR